MNAPRLFPRLCAVATGASLVLTPTLALAAPRQVNPLLRGARANVVYRFVDLDQAGGEGPAQPGPPQPGAPQPGAPQPGAARSNASAIGTGLDSSPRPGVGGTTQAPIIHVINAKPDEDRGFLKLVQHVDSTASHHGDTTIITTRYKEICREPCGVPVDVTDRPILYFMRDGSPVTRGFRVPKGSENITVKVKPRQNGLLFGGMVLTVMLILPAGIPMWVVGRDRLWVANGPPAPGQAFTRLRK